LKTLIFACWTFCFGSSFVDQDIENDSRVRLNSCLMVVVKRRWNGCPIPLSFLYIF